MTYISLLRGVNIGKKQMKMAVLKQLYESMGLENVQTYVQSGNVIFESKKGNVKELEELIGKQIEHEFGFTAEVLIRTPEELWHILETNPFLGKKDVDTTRLYVTFLTGEPSASARGKVGSFKSDPDEFEVIGTEIYLHCPVGYGITKLSNTFFEKKLGLVATTRNWRTVNMLSGIAEGRGPQK